MAFNKKKKNIKDLDNVFQMIEDKENIAETEEEKEIRTSKEKEMKKIRIVLILLLSVFILATIFYIAFIIYENVNQNYALLKSKNRSETIITNVDETLLQNYLQPNRKTVVAFWASWCPHCQNEASSLNRFILEYDDVNVIVVSHDRELDTLKKFFETNKKYNWFIIYDIDRTIRNSIDSKASTIPLTYILNDKGEILNKVEGEISYETLQKLYEGNE